MSSSTSSTSSSSSSTGLTQADYLSLMTTQLKNQDPLDPMKDTDFIAAMANFTALEQTSDISKTLTGMASSMGLTGATSAYLGKDVKLTDSGATVSGTVSEVSSQKGVTYVTINGKQYDASTIKSVTNPAASATTNS